MTALLSLRHLSVRYESKTVVEDVGLDVSKGELVGLIGPNGAGKTTLLRACAGLIAPASGEIRLEDRPLDAWQSRERARKVGYLAQDRTVLWPMTAARLVALGRLPYLGPWDGATGEDEDAVVEAMTATDVLDLADRPVTALSGGELTRVLVARLLAGAPTLFLADEPVSGLDPAHAMQVLSLFQSLARQGRTVVVVLHDLTLAARFCDRLVLMDEGRVIADGAPMNVLTPAHFAQSYGIGAEIITHGGVPLIVPHAL